MANDLLGRIEEWRRKLLDLTNRNQLVSCKLGPRAAIRLEHPSPGQVWSGLLGGADLTFAWKRELVPDANESGDDNNESPQLSLFGSKGEGQQPVEPRITLEQCLESCGVKLPVGGSPVAPRLEARAHEWRLPFIRGDSTD